MKQTSNRGLNAASVLNYTLKDVLMFLAVAKQIPIICIQDIAQQIPITCIQDITPHEALHGVL